MTNNLLARVEQAVRKKVREEWEASHYGDMPEIRFQQMVNSEYTKIVNKLVFDD